MIESEDCDGWELNIPVLEVDGAEVDSDKRRWKRGERWVRREGERRAFVTVSRRDE